MLTSTDLSNVVIAELPFVTPQNKAKLPSASGVYFVTNKDLLLYVGEAGNIQERWTSHHRYSQIVAFPNPQIHWFLCDDHKAVEAKAIALFKPIMNGWDKLKPNQDALQKSYDEGLKFGKELGIAFTTGYLTGVLRSANAAMLQNHFSLDTIQGAFTCLNMVEKINPNDVFTRLENHLKKQQSSK